MANLLLKIYGHPVYNRTIFPPTLFIYDDIMIYRKRRWYYFIIDEFTLSYSHIVQVNLTKGIIFATLELINSGVRNLQIKYIYKDSAVKAKKIIDQKIFFSLAKEKPREDPKMINRLYSIEMSINRLRELLSKGKITQSQFNKMRQELLNDKR